MCSILDITHAEDSTLTKSDLQEVFGEYLKGYPGMSTNEFEAILTRVINNVEHNVTVTGSDHVEQPPDACHGFSDCVRYFGTLFLGAFAAVITIFGYRSARDSLRRKATLDLNNQWLSSEFYQKAETTFYRLAKIDNNGVLAAICADKSINQDIGEAISGHISHCEATAIGIRAGIVDENMYRQWFEISFVGSWIKAKNYVQQSRWRALSTVPSKGKTLKRESYGDIRDDYIYNPDAFCMFEDLAIEWFNDLVEPKKPPFYIYLFASLHKFTFVHKLVLGISNSQQQIEGYKRRLKNKEFNRALLGESLDRLPGDNVPPKSPAELLKMATHIPALAAIPDKGSGNVR